MSEVINLKLQYKIEKEVLIHYLSLIIDQNSKPLC